MKKDKLNFDDNYKWIANFKWISAKEIGLLLNSLGSHYTETEAFKIVEDQLFADKDTIVGYRNSDDGKNLETAVFLQDKIKK